MAQTFKKLVEGCKTKRFERSVIRGTADARTQYLRGTSLIAVEYDSGERFYYPTSNKFTLTLWGGK